MRTKGLLLLLPVFPVVVELAGCCTAPPPAGKYFDRATPMNALLGFAYSVEAGYWEYAFESLDEESRRQIETPTRLKWGSILEEDPDFGIPIRSIVTEAIRHRREAYPDPAAPRSIQRIEILYVDPETAEPKIQIEVIMVLQEDEWRVDLGRTVQRNWPDLL